ncbi:MAG: M1 family metallopeptidase [Tannerella sp.]|jgi:aminopeptidase N|nr:M1 family metallopeptidase [Tannerella sp.]
MKGKIILTVLLSSVLITNVCGQRRPFNRPITRQDTLRGSITPERAWWDLAYYHLSVKVNPADSSFEGQNIVEYRVIEPNQLMQIDLQEPMTISKITQNGEEQDFVRDGNAWFVTLKNPQIKGARNQIIVEYGGKPQRGVNWGTDEKGRPFVTTSNQGLGGSSWWPCKDHPSDEPDSMLMSITFPGKLMDVSNGRLRKVQKNRDGTKTAHWFVANPINNYGVNINVGNYVNFSDIFKGEKGDLDCNYWVMDYNIDKAKIQFKQAHQMLEAFEHWFGPYPFYEDGYKLVEVPYAGMEHQSSVTYGNGFKNGYGGRDVSFTGIGMRFDFIIIHESGHEWFANSITNSDEADMWIHESFTAYAENLFVEYFWGKDTGAAYCRGTRMGIMNDRPVVGTYGVNRPGSRSDMYYKGANMLHTIRQLVDDDEKWRRLLHGLNVAFYHQTVNAGQIEDFMIKETGLELKPVFDQYLRDTRIPTLEYAFTNDGIRYRWGNCVNDFNMKIKVYINGKMHWLQPTQRWENLTLGSGEKCQSFECDKDFYVASFHVADIE